MILNKSEQSIKACIVNVPWIILVNYVNLKNNLTNTCKYTYFKKNCKNIIIICSTKL